MVLQSEPRGSLCAVAFTVIEADLEAFSPGRMAAFTTTMAGLRRANELFKRSCTRAATELSQSILLREFLVPVMSHKAASVPCLAECDGRAHCKQI